MACHAQLTTIEDVTTGIIETRASSEPISIQLEMPSFAKQLVNHMRKRSLMIDTCIIKYSPQCPPNSTGNVRIVIYDDRLIGDDNRQAEFTFPVTYQVELTYFGSSFASANEKSCPWRATYYLEGSNLKSNTFFSKIKGYLKFCTSTFPIDVNIRPPTIKVLSKNSPIHKVDVWHCKPSEPIRALCRTTSYKTSYARFNNMLESGIGHAASELESRNSVSDFRPIKENEDDPGPSASEVSGSSSGPSHLAVMPEQMGQLIDAVVQAIKIQPNASGNQIDKPRFK